MYGHRKTLELKFCYELASVNCSPQNDGNNKSNKHYVLSRITIKFYEADDIFSHTIVSCNLSITLLGKRKKKYSEYNF